LASGHPKGAAIAANLVKENNSLSREMMEKNQIASRGTLPPLAPSLLKPGTMLLLTVWLLLPMDWTPVAMLVGWLSRSAISTSCFSVAALWIAFVVTLVAPVTMKINFTSRKGARGAEKRETADSLPGQNVEHARHARHVWCRNSHAKYQ
jgi:hypothetical protein